MRLVSRYCACPLILAVLCGILGCGKGDSAPANPRQFHPAVCVLDLDGQPFDIWPQVRDAITVIVFTRSDCPISNRYAPEVRRLYETYRPRGVAFYLVYVDPQEHPDRIRQHLRDFHYPCPALRDPLHMLVTFCGATRTPEAVVFDHRNAIVYLGRIDDLYADVGRPRAVPTTHDLADAIEATLLGRPIAHPRTEPVGCPIADLKD